MRRLFPAFVVLALFAMTGFVARSQDAKDKEKKQVPAKKTPEEVLATLPKRTVAAMPYGTHERQVLDFWQAKSDKPTPLVLYIHGGGWQTGDKRGIGAGDQQYLDAGISVVAINYRYVKNGRRGEDRAAGEGAAGRRRPRLAVRFAPRRANGTSTRNASAPPAARPAPARRCGWPSTTTWPIPRATIRSPANRPGSIARPSTAPRCRSIRRNSASGCRTTATAPTPSACKIPRAVRQSGQSPEVDQGIFADRARHEGRSADLPGVRQQETPPVVGTEQKDPTHSGVMGIKLAGTLQGGRRRVPAAQCEQSRSERPLQEHDGVSGRSAEEVNPPTPSPPKRGEGAEKLVRR